MSAARQNYCVFVATGEENRYRCERCGFLSPATHHPPERIYKICRQPGAARSRGLGDTLAWLIHLLTFGLVTPCSACNSRRSRLNKLFPYERK